MNIDIQLDKINDIREWLEHLELLKHNDPNKKLAVDQSIEMWKLEIARLENEMRKYLSLGEKI